VISHFKAALGTGGARSALAATF